MTKVINVRGEDMANRAVIVKDIEGLIEVIVKAGYSYRQLAKATNCSQTQISLILKGERNPSPETAINICKVLKCSFDDIFFINNNDKCNR